MSKLNYLLLLEFIMTTSKKRVFVIFSTKNNFIKEIRVENKNDLICLTLKCVKEIKNAKFYNTIGDAMKEVIKLQSFVGVNKDNDYKVYSYYC